jgi:tRNA(fMet)-specific endonuclease VapC
MVLLDTDHMSLLERGGVECKRILSRLRAIPPKEVATSIVNFEEQTRGWLARIAQAPTLARQVINYGELRRLIGNYCDNQVLEFDSLAASEFERLRKERVRIGTMDLKIAAVALANDATLLTRNLSDFQRVPNLRTEDWSV